MWRIINFDVIFLAEIICLIFGYLYVIYFQVGFRARERLRVLISIAPENINVSSERDKLTMTWRAELRRQQQQQ